MPKPTPSAHRSSAQIAQSLKLYDCLVKVADTSSDKSAMFWLSCYLKTPSGLQKDGSIQCTALSYTRFCYDLESHFDYSPELHEIQWENSLPGSVIKAESGSKNADDHTVAPLCIQTHNSWVTALMVMQANQISALAQPAGPAESSSKATAASSKTAGASSKNAAPTALPGLTVTAATFKIVRKEATADSSEIESVVSNDTTDSDEPNDDIPAD